MTANLVHWFRWGLFWLRWLYVVAYRLLLFVSKPGSAATVPVGLAVAAYACRRKLEAFELQCLAMDWRHLPEPLTLEAGFAVTVAVAVCACTVLPRVFDRWRVAGSVVSGIFNLILRLAILLGIAALGMGWYDGLPLDTHLPAALLARLPVSVTQYLPTDLAYDLPGIDWRQWRWDAVLSLPVALHVALAGAVVLAGCVYVVLSRILEKLLGAFPPALRPLPPLARLHATAKTIRAVPVRIVVPRLPASSTPR